MPRDINPYLLHGVVIQVHHYHQILIFATGLPGSSYSLSYHHYYLQFSQNLRLFRDVASDVNSGYWNIAPRLKQHPEFPGHQPPSSGCKLKQGVV